MYRPQKQVQDEVALSKARNPSTKNLSSLRLSSGRPQGQSKYEGIESLNRKIRLEQLGAPMVVDHPILRKSEAKLEVSPRTAIVTRRPDGLWSSNASFTNITGFVFVENFNYASRSESIATSSNTWTDSGYGSKASDISKPNLLFSTSDINPQEVAESVTVDLETPTSQPINNEDHVDAGIYSAPTIYSASTTSSRLAPIYGAQIDEIATAIFQSVTTLDPSELVLQGISAMLPELLKAFANRIGHSATSDKERDVAYFVRKHRSRIKASFDDLCASDDDDSIVEIRPNAAKTSIRGEFAIERFLKEESEVLPVLGTTTEKPPEMEPRYTDDIERTETRNHIAESDGVPADDEINERIANMSTAYIDLVKNSLAFRWLLESLKRVVTLDWSACWAMNSIRRRILECLPSVQKVSRHTVPRVFNLMLELDWDPINFFQQQNYVESFPEAIRHAITLTGNIAHAQALTTREYLLQVWPETGPYILELVTRVTANAKEHVSFRAWLKPSTGSRYQYLTEIEGISDTVIEVIQQLAWLGSALRASPFDSSVGSCHPYIDTLNIAHAEQGDTFTVPALCTIKFDLRSEKFSSRGIPGQCWMDMFHNPMLVRGFPVRRRAETQLGLEIPLNMMAKLINNDRAHAFDSRVFVKGFSSMLASMRMSQDVMLWHYVFNREGKHVSYLDAPEVSGEINLYQLDDSRHIIGWCHHSHYLVGATEATYGIDETGLPPPHAGAALEKLNISGGKVITFGAQIALGIKDVPPHIRRSSYVDKLRWLDTKYVVLWDDAEKKGWLVNGTSTLLHLLRANLYSTARGNFSSQLIFDTAKMENSDHYWPNSAVEVLLSQHNRQLGVYSNKNEMSREKKSKEAGQGVEELVIHRQKTEYFLFEDLVEQQFESLEKLIQYQQKVAGQNGVNIKPRMRKHLEGWDFVDIANFHDAYPRIATLNALGWGWVNYVRSIGALILFGRGFGELMKPILSDGICSQWQSLPSNKYYLAATVFDLESITRLHGNRWATPPEPVHGLVWHCPQELFAQCRCQKPSGRMIASKTIHQHVDPVQVFYPRNMHRVARHVNINDLDRNSAIIFGHNVSWMKRWKNDGADDELEDLEPGEENIDAQMQASVNLSVTASGSSQSPEEAAGTSQSSAGYNTHSTPPTSASTLSHTTTRVELAVESPTRLQLSPPLGLERSESDKQNDDNGQRSQAGVKLFKSIAKRWPARRKR